MAVSLSPFILLSGSCCFLPTTERVPPQRFGIDRIEEVALENGANERLYSWYARAAEGRPTFLFFHGNGGNVSHRLHKFRQLMAVGYGVFMLGYPGYGGSDGRPSEPAFVEAAKLALAHLDARGIAREDLVVYGESLGSAVAVQLCANQPIRALILESPMSSIQEIAQLHYPFLPVSLLLKDRFLSIDYIADVRAPLLVIHGSADDVIPIQSGRRLFERANEPKTFHTVEGGGHNDLFDFPVVDVINAFLD